MIGVTGAGKSCLGNFLSKREEAYKEFLETKTKTASMASALFEEHKICVIDTPGLENIQNLGKHDYKAMHVTEDAASIINELTKITMTMTKGIRLSAFLIVTSANVREHSGTLNLLDFMDIFGNYWDHAILVVTHGIQLGKSEKEQERSFQRTVHGVSCPPIWDKLYSKVNARCVIVEAKEYRSDTAYTDSVISKLLSFTDKIVQEHGPYHDDLHSIGNQALEFAKMQVRERYSNLESRAAKEAVERIACERVKKVLYKLIRIKMADGKDVDQLEEMAKLKTEENQKLQEETIEIHQQMEEEQKRRKQAEKEKHKAEEEMSQADEARHIAEEWEEEDRKGHIVVERTNDYIQKLVQNLESERDEAKQRLMNERRWREAAVKEKNAAEQKLLQEKYRREATEQSLKVEKEKRKSLERENDSEVAKREAREKYRLGNAEQEVLETNAEKKVLHDRLLRQIAEEEKIEAQRDSEVEKGKEHREEAHCQTVVEKGESNGVELLSSQNHAQYSD